MLALAAAPAVLPCARAIAGTPTAAPRPFAHSIFDIPVSGRPTVPSSALLVEDLTSQYREHYGSVGVNQIPVFVVPAAQRRVPVGQELGCGKFEASTGDVPIPAGAYTSDPGDRDMIVEQPSTNSVWELWRANRSLLGSWSACWGGRLDTASSSGVFPAPYGLAASGISYLATMITESDVESGSIDHAIAIQVPSCHGWIAPAVRGDCRSWGEEVSEGAWLRLPSDVPVPAGLTPLAQMVVKALQTYGAVVTDHAGAVMAVAESQRDWTFAGHYGTDPITAASHGQPEYRVLDGVPWQDLQVISPPSVG